MLYKAELQIDAEDRNGMLVDVSKVLTEQNVPIRNMNARITSDNRSIFNITIEIRNAEQLSVITKKLMNISGVYEVVRTKS